jgi:hypothetical protein
VNALLLDIGGFTAAVIAGAGGCLLGVRAADAINRKLGRIDKDQP